MFELGIAHTDSLQRNFQGYSTQEECDMLGFGVTSIGKIQNLYYQNLKGEKDYFDSLDKRKLPIAQGYHLSEDDNIRRRIIMSLMCQGELDLRAFKKEIGQSFFTISTRQCQHC